MLPTVDGENNDICLGRPEVDRVWKPIQGAAPRLTAHTLKGRRTLDDPVNECVDFRRELIAEPCAPLVVPTTNLENLILGLWSKDGG